MQPPPRKRIQLFRAVSAMRNLKDNPEDTAQFALALESLEGDASRRLYRRMQKSERGRALLQSPPDLTGRLSDRAYLRALPEGSLGRAYLSFCEREQISSEGLTEVIEQGRARAHAGQAKRHFVTDWMRDTHDLYHVVMGYGTDLLGELCVLVFTACQTGNLAVVAPVLYGAPLLARVRPDALGLGLRAAVRGRQAAFFATQNWAELLGRPLEEVRAMLRVGPPEPYEPLYFASLSPLRKPARKPSGFGRAVHAAAEPHS